MLHARTRGSFWLKRRHLTRRLEPDSVARGGGITRRSVKNHAGKGLGLISEEDKQQNLMC